MHLPVKAIGTFLTNLDLVWILLGFAAIMVGFFFLFGLSKKLKAYRGQMMVITGLCLFFLLFFLMTFAFKIRKAQMIHTTAATVPRAWIFLMIPVAIMVITSILNGKSGTDEPFGRWVLTLGIAAAAFISVFLFEYIGYYLSSALLLILMMFLLRERKVAVLVGVPVGWVLFTYFVFAKLLYITLPIGSLWTTLF